MYSNTDTSTLLTIIKRRNRLRFISTILVLLAHAGFIGGIIFYRDWFASPLGDGTITVGIAATIATIVFFLVVELVYTVLIPKLDDLSPDSTEHSNIRED